MATQLLALEAALALLETIPVPAPQSETASVSDALGRVLASDLMAPFDLPGFDNSAVDGFAVRAEDARAGAILNLVGSSYAGEPFDGDLQSGCAVRIATGAAVPQGANAIVMLEVCTDTGSTVTIHEAPEPGAHIRKAGQDVKQDALVLKAGTRLAAPHLAMAAALGHETVAVRQRLRVAIASTGSELVEAGPRQPGQIYDSNRVLLRSLLHAYGVEIIDLGILLDDADATRAALIDAAGRADLIVTSGGVSVGLRDFVRDTLQQAGEVLFWRLAIKPGKPLLCGRIADTPILAVPGNPVSTFVTFQLVCRPLLLRLLGVKAKPLLRIPVRMGFMHKKSAALQEFARVTLDRDAGALIVKPFRSQLSNLVSSLLESDGIVDLPMGVDTVPQGQVVDFLPWSGFVL